MGLSLILTSSRLSYTFQDDLFLMGGFSWTTCPYLHILIPWAGMDGWLDGWMGEPWIDRPYGFLHAQMGTGLRSFSLSR